MKARTLVLLPLVALIGGCSAPEPVALAAACTASNDGKDIAVEGYVADGTSVYCSDTSGEYECGLFLVTDPDQGPKEKPYLKVDVKVGDGPNEMDKPVSVKKLRIRADDGSQVTSRTLVRVSGEATVDTKVCWVTADTIEKI